MGSWELVEAKIVLSSEAVRQLVDEARIFQKHYPDGVNFRCTPAVYNRKEIVHPEPITALILSLELPDQQLTATRQVHVGPAYWEKTVLR
jgi:hypothetical protein